MRALAANRELTPMTQAAIAAKVHQTLDVDRHFAPQIALDHIVAVNRLTNLQDFRIRQLSDAALGWDHHLFTDFFGLFLADAMNILERDNHALIGRYINASDTSHTASP
jgi:hypothetical protein